jgi:hypothetical protein
VTQPLHGGSNQAKTISVTAPTQPGQKVWVTANFKIDTEGLDEFRTTSKIFETGVCTGGCTLSNPIAAPLLVSVKPPQMATLPANFSIDGTYYTYIGMEPISGFKMNGSLQVQLLTLLPSGTALTGPDGRDYVPYCVSGSTSGSGDPFGGGVTATFDGDSAGAGICTGEIVECTNSTTGMLDVRPLVDVGSGTLFFDGYPNIMLPGGVDGSTSFPYVLAAPIDNLSPMGPNPAMTPVPGESDAKDNMGRPVTVTGTATGEGGSLGCAVARFDYIQGAWAQRAAAVVVLWLPLFILAMMRRRARLRSEPRA